MPVKGLLPRWCWALVIALGLAWPAAAREAVPLAVDAALEARVQRLSEELRCLVCQNQTIADSHAALAVDLKRQIRAMIAQGSGDAEILQYMTDRYGDFVLYRPPVKATTVLLWVGPFVLLALALVIVWLNVRRRRAHDPGVEDEGGRPAAGIVDPMR